MPLYNNILLSRKNTDGDSKHVPPPSSSKKQESNQQTNASMKLLQDHLLSKRRSQQQIQQKPPSAAKNTERSHDVNKSISNTSQIISESELHKQHDCDWNPEDEYDPMVPNSYEILQTEWLKNKKLSKLTAPATQNISGSKKVANPLNLLDVLDKLEDDEDSYDDNGGVKGGTSIAPPPSLSTSKIEDSDQISKTPTTVRFATPLNVAAENKQTDGSSVAAKIMSKMGYKVGHGLGKDEQGMSSPLEVTKSGVNIGKIVNASIQYPQHSKIQPNSETICSEEQDKMAVLLRESTRVLLLQNMVGPGEVDEDLDSETKEECKKYGDVIKCLIYEIPNKRVPDEEAVRIFVEFRTVESAIKAVSDLNGRFFGGRIVRASFYSLEKFNKYELAP